jgi:hypothetical protein
MLAPAFCGRATSDLDPAPIIVLPPEVVVVPPAEVVVVAERDPFDLGDVRDPCSSIESEVCLRNESDRDLIFEDLELAEPFHPAFSYSIDIMAGDVVARGQRICARVVFAPISPGRADGAFSFRFRGLPDPITLRVTAEGIFDDVIVEVFQQLSTIPIDMLFVIDGSAATLPHRANTLAQLDSAVRSLAPLYDYRLAVTTMDPAREGRFADGDGSRPAVVEPSTPDATAVFLANADVFTGASVESRGLEAAYRALSRRVETAFPRQDTNLFIFFISAEDDRSGGPPDLYFDYFAGLDETLAIAAITPPGSASCGPARGATYIAMSRRTGGFRASICDPSWGHWQSTDPWGVRSRFFLRRKPRGASIDVRIFRADGTLVEPTPPWVYHAETNSITFSPWPPELGSRIEVSFQSDTCS